MGWTKDEVDKYVAKIERNMKDPTEKNRKGFAFARLYREANDNNKAQRHLEAYLSVNETDFRGHRMMGQLFEETGNLEKALASYRRSLDLNNTQHDLVLKVVELYCQVPVDPGRARAWADRAARLYPGHAAVFKLKMHLLESAGRIDYDQMEDLITEEMAKRPRDVELRVRLVRVYASTGRLIDAFKHCASVVKTKAFANDQEWGQCAIDIFEKYMAGQDKMIPSDRDIGPGHVILEVHAHLLGALCQLLSLNLKTESVRDCRNALYRLDHCLHGANMRKIRQMPRVNYRTEWEVVLTEIRGQLYHHCGTLVLKLAKENYITWPRALRLASVCYLVSTQATEPEINTPWVAMASKSKDALRWYRMACHRLSHSGHILSGIASKYGVDWLDECISDWCTQQGQDEIINTIYSQQQDLSKSFLANDEEFFHLELNIPSTDQMIKYDEGCVGDNPRSLQHIAWIGLHWHQFEGRVRPGVGVIVNRIFNGLRMDAHNIEQTAAETLCLRDLEAFLYAVIKTSSAKHLEDSEAYQPDYQPQILPQQLCVPLVSEAQEEWWTAAYNLYTGAASVGHTGRVRATVQRGLEDIRAQGNHGLHVRLLIFLAFNFWDKASYLKTSGANPWHYEEHWKSLQRRGLHYWKEALVLLETFERNENIPVRKNPLFEPLPDNLKKVDVKFNIQKARLILGEAAVKEGKIEEAMEMFEQVKTTQGMWNLAQIYKYLADVEAHAAATDDLGSEAHSIAPAQEYYNCLNKARGLLLLCMEKVGSEERQRQILQDELNDIEDKLNEDPNKTRKATKKQLDFRQLDFQASRSSTTVSDVQESEDNFWLDQPQDGSSKDLIAKLSEVTLNNGYLQEQMALRDQRVLDLTSKVEHLESELRELKRRQNSSGIMSPRLTSSHDASNDTPLYLTANKKENNRGYATESTPVSKPSVKSRLGPKMTPVQPQLPKIDSNFFAGLSDSNSPEKRLEQDYNDEEEKDEEEEQQSEAGSPGYSASYDDGIHFKPLIPLPKKVEKLTGEEEEKILFSKRAKLYRFDKSDKSWKERGRGTIKILCSEDSTRFRILMRRDNTLKICANHVITSDMVLKPASDSGNGLVWTTVADYSDEIPKVEQLAVRFKLPEEATEFKEVFTSCKGTLSGKSKSSASKVIPKLDSNLKSSITSVDGAPVFSSEKVSPKASQILSSEPSIESTKTKSAFVLKPKEKDLIQEASMSLGQPLFGGNSSFTSFASSLDSFTKATSLDNSVKSNSKGSFSFEFKPQQSPDQETNQAKPNKSLFATQHAAPFPFTSTFGSPLKFSFGPTQAPSTSGASVEPTASSETQRKFPTLFGAVTAPKSTDKTSSPEGCSFGSAATDERTSDGSSNVKDAPLKFSLSPNVGFGISDDEDEAKTDSIRLKESIKPETAHSTKEQFISSQDKTPPAMTATKIMPQLFWQQQLEEKFTFGNLHKTQPLAGMAPAVTSSGKSGILYPASLMLAQIAGKSPTGSQVQPSNPNLSHISQSQHQEVRSVQGGSKESFNPFRSQTGSPFLPGSFSTSTVTTSDQTEDDYDDYSDDEYDTDAEDTESYDSNEDDFKAIPRKVEISNPFQQVNPKESTSVNKTERKVLTARSSLKKSQPLDDCVIVWQVEPSKIDHDKASRLLLPPNFFNFSRLEPCQGCLGCDETRKSLTSQEKQDSKASIMLTTQRVHDNSENKKGLTIFGASGNNMLSFSSCASSSNWASNKSDSAKHAFPMAGQPLFSAADDQDVDPSEEVDIHFKPIISLPDLVETKSDEDNHTLLFSERARLYRYDSSSSMWKERGVGDIKLLLDNKSGRGRVVMRRNQVHKLCANHWVTKDMTLISNSTSERSWIWQTLSDFSEEEPSQEKLAVRFKSPERTKKFKEVFDDLIAKAKVSPPSVETRKPFQPPAVSKMPKLWNCDTCYCLNPEKDVKCIACGSGRPETKQGQGCKAGSEIVESPKSKEMQSSRLPNAVFPVTSLSGMAKIESRPVFTIGRGNGPEDDPEELDLETSVSKSSPLKSSSKASLVSGISTSQNESLFGSGFGSPKAGKFNFRLDLKPDDDKTKAKSPVKSPLKSPIKSPRSPKSPGSPSGPETEDDGIHFEPLIHLPKLTTYSTGEENERTQFCQRAKLYRYDSECNQWKERGLGQIKILVHVKNGKSRIIMRRENVLKICVNHQITTDMELKPKTEKSWVWNTLADIADEVPKPETLAIRFKDAENALAFKDAFESGKASAKKETVKDQEKKPMENTSEETSPNTNTSGDDSSTPEKGQSSTEDDKDASLFKSYLFGSSKVSELSFASVAANLGSSSPCFKDKKESPEFQGKGSQLFPDSESSRKDSENEDQHDNDPHFEAIIPLPDKIEVKTGEEEEDVMFSHRAKLYRFDKSTKQWKERGVGEIKILYHNENGRARVLMRRDQIHKICANHYITKEMTLAPNNNSEKSFVWNTLADFSDEEVKAEQLAVRFKLEKTAQEFKTKFEECQKKVAYKQSPDSKTNTKSTTQSPESKVDDTANGADSGHLKTDYLLEKFKPKPGTWECEACLISNKPNLVTCVACNSSKPGSTQNQTPVVEKSASSKLDTSVSLFDKLKPATGSSQQTGFDFSASNMSNQSKAVFSFGSSAFGSPGSNFQDKPAFGFGTTKTSGFTFGQSDGRDETKPQVFSFGSSDSFRKDETSTSDQVSSGQSEAPKPTGFNFTFGTKPSSSSFSPANSGFVFGSSKESKSCVKEDLPIQGKDYENSDTSAMKSKDPLMEKFQPKQGAWECDSCLIQNKAGSTVCAACQNPKPGSEANRAQSSDLPSIKFGSTTNQASSGHSEQPKPTGFNFTFGAKPSNSSIGPANSAFVFETSKEQKSIEKDDLPILSDNDGKSDSAAASDAIQAPSGQQNFNFGSNKTKGFTFDSSKTASESPFGSGFLFGFKTPDTTLKQPEKDVSSNTESEGTSSIFGSVKQTGFSFAETSGESKGKDSMISSVNPEFRFGTTCEKSTSPETDSFKKSLDLGKGHTEEADSTGSPEIEEIYCSAFANRAQCSPGDLDQTLTTDESDPTITAVIEPTDEERARARSLLLPEGFFLYDRQPTAASNGTEQTLKPNKDIPPSKPIENEMRDIDSSRSGVFGSSSSSSFASFSDLTPNQGFQFGTKNSKGFAGQGSQLFTSKPCKDDENPSEERDIHFDPIVNLPKVEVKTGEENEEIIFSHRAQLYRYDPDLSTWKERGVGDIKILKLKDGNKFRILMRRDQIRKLCANHIITKDMKLVANSMSDRSWVWTTLADWSDEKPSPEQLAVRFKSPDTAGHFKEVFEECQVKMSKDSTDSVSEQSSNSNAAKPIENQEHPPMTSQGIGKQVSDAGAIFTATNPPASTTIESWECKPCCIPNLKEQVKCLSCGEPKYINVKKSSSPIGKQTSDVKREDNQEEPDSSFAEKSLPGHWKCSTCNSLNLELQPKCLSCGGSTHSNTKGTTGERKETLGTKINDSQVEPDSSNAQDLMPKEHLKAESVSSSSAAKINLFGDVSSSEPFSFKGLNEYKADQDIKEDENDRYHNVSGDHIHFDPIIPLPAAVKVVTGEENHEVLFKERAKLFRFDKVTKQWKERGVGELKILSKAGRARIVMRRDHIHTLCANHAITSDMVLKPNGNSDRSWIWQTIADFSQQEQKAEQLAVRLKTTEIANAFKKTFDECAAQEVPSSSTGIEKDVKSAGKSLQNKPTVEWVESSDSVDTKNVSNAPSTLMPVSSSISNEQSSSVQRCVTSSKTIAKQMCSQQTTSTVKVDKSGSAKILQETKVLQDTKVKETKAFSVEVQNNSVSSSSESTQFFKSALPHGVTGSPPTIFNQQLFSQKGRGFSQGGMVPIDQTAFISSFANPQLTLFESTTVTSEKNNFTQATRSAQQMTSSSQTETKVTEDSKGQLVEEKKVIQSFETRKVEATHSVSSPTEKFDESKMGSCSPEITKILQEIQDSDKN